MSEYDNDGRPVRGAEGFSKKDYLLGSDEGQRPATFSKKVIADALFAESEERDANLEHLGDLKDGDIIVGYRNNKKVTYTYDAILGAKPQGLVFSNQSVVDTGLSAKIKFKVTDREGFAYTWRIKYVGSDFNAWSGDTPSGTDIEYSMIPMPIGSQTIEIQAKTGFIVEPVVYRANVTITASSNEDVSLTLTASDGEEISNVTAVITDTSGDDVYWRGKHDLGEYTDWQGPYSSPHQVSWNPSVPGGVRTITMQGKAYDTPPFAEQSRTVTITEAPLFPGQFKLINPNATHDRNIRFTKTIRFNASADATQIQLIGRKHTGEWIYNGAWFVAQGENRIDIPITLPYNLDSSNKATGTTFFWKVVMEGGSEEYEFDVSTLTPPSTIHSMDGYNTVKDWQFGTGGNITNAADLSADFDWGMFYGAADPNHPKNNPTEWQLFTDFTSTDNYAFGANYLAIKPKNTVAPNAPTQNDITSGSIRSKYTIAGEAYKSYFVEATVILPQGKGFWPAFWLFPGGAGDKGKSEIDVFEFVGTVDELDVDGKFTDLHTNFHQHGANAPLMNHVQYGSTLSQIVPSPSGHTHTYAVEIDGPNKKLRYYYDNRMIREANYEWNATNGEGWSPAPAAEVILNLSIGGDWPGPADNAADYGVGAANMIIYSLKISSKTG